MTVTLINEFMQPKPLSYFDACKDSLRLAEKLAASITASKFGKMSNIYIQEPPTNGKV